MTLEPLEQLILHWLGYEGEPDQIYLGFFTDHLEAPGSVGYQDLRKDCYLAGVELPSTQQFLDFLQALIEDGYAGAEIDEEEQVDDVRDLPNAVEPWDVAVFATMEGLQEIESFEEEMDEAREAKTGEFVRKHLDEVRRTLPFSAVIPPYILADEDVLRRIDVGTDNETLRLSYEFGMDPFNTVTIDQTIGQLAQLDPPKAVLSERSAKLASVSVSLREHQLNTHTPGLSPNG